MNEDIVNILVIDDSRFDRELIKSKLIKHFPNAVFTFGEGMEDYKDRVSWVKPDVILCDYDMKDCNGLEILLLSKKSWDVPFIFVTGALNNEEEVAQAILRGANGYVLKDNLDDLHMVVEKAVEENKKIKDKERDIQEMFVLISLDIEKIRNLAFNRASYDEIVNTTIQLENKLANVQQ
ncbi:response regulator [Portibacter marinus]|uniref:response regulator n=1 Tax=Portibacter marinus TaxID=2898660 RepID=UPI001F182747|nr:response regulator [Portibacter marinus]